MSAPRGFEDHAVIIGGGIIGLACARELAKDGWRTTVLERGKLGREASHVAAGMLAAHLEFDDASPLRALALESQALYPQFARDLTAEVGIDIGLRLDGMLAPCPRRAVEGNLPRGAEVVSGDDLRRLEPALHPSIAAAYLFKDAGSVDNQRVVAALCNSCRALGVDLQSGVDVREVLAPAKRVTGVRTNLGTLPAGAVVNCGGAWSSAVAVPEARVDVRPVKGQILLLQAPCSLDQHSAGIPRRTIYSDDVYIVPRGAGRIVVGATVEERGFNKDVEAWAIQRLLAAATRIVPGLANARLRCAWAGLRPRLTARGAEPQIGPLGPSGYFVAVGHYRNGILLGPLTARRIRTELERFRRSRLSSLLTDS